MAKKTTANKKKKAGTSAAEQTLPMNFISVGEQVVEDKNIYISQPVYQQIHKFTKNKTSVETGGFLIGRYMEAFGKTNIIINGFLEAKGTEGTATTLKFTHETWNRCHKEMDAHFPGQKIVGWIHTHPNYGIFLSNHDKFIQESTFSDENQIAYVVDPIRGEEGFFFWINGKIEQCKGFYIFDKTGKKIEIEETANEPAQERAAIVGGFDFWKVLAVILTLAVALSMYFIFTLSNRVRKLETQVSGLTSASSTTGVYPGGYTIIPGTGTVPTQGATDDTEEARDSQAEQTEAQTEQATEQQTEGGETP